MKRPQRRNPQKKLRSSRKTSLVSKIPPICYSTLPQPFFFFHVQFIFTDKVCLAIPQPPPVLHHEDRLYHLPDNVVCEMLGISMEGYISHKIHKFSAKTSTSRKKLISLLDPPFATPGPFSIYHIFQNWRRIRSYKKPCNKLRHKMQKSKTKISLPSPPPQLPLQRSKKEKSPKDQVCLFLVS